MHSSACFVLGSLVVDLVRSIYLKQGLSDVKTPNGSEFEEDDTEELGPESKIIVGVCAMNKKV